MVDTNGSRPPGFKVIPRNDYLDLAGTDLEGAKIRCRLDVSMDTYVAMQELVDGMVEGNMKGLPELARNFGDHILLDWNLIDESDEPIPDGSPGMLMLPGRLALMIIGAWVSFFTTVPSPLAPGSQDGELSEELLTSLAEKYMTHWPSFPFICATWKRFAALS